MSPKLPLFSFWPSLLLGLGSWWLSLAPESCHGLSLSFLTRTRGFLVQFFLCSKNSRDAKELHSISHRRLVPPDEAILPCSFVLICFIIIPLVIHGSTPGPHHWCHSGCICELWIQLLLALVPLQAGMLEFRLLALLYGVSTGHLESHSSG